MRCSVCRGGGWNVDAERCSFCGGTGERLEPKPFGLADVIIIGLAIVVVVAVLAGIFWLGGGLTFQ